MTSEEIAKWTKYWAVEFDEGSLDSFLLAIQIAKEDQREEDARIAAKHLVRGSVELVFPHNNACYLIEQSIRDQEIK